MALGFAVPAAAQDGLTKEEASAAIGEIGLAGTYEGTVWSIKLNEDFTFFIAPELCTEATGKCRLFIVFAKFNIESDMAAVADKLNAYNREKIVGRAVLDEGNTMRIDYSIRLGDGATKTYFKNRIAEFPEVVKIFIDLLGPTTAE